MQIMTSSPITSWQIDGETMETLTDCIFLVSKITADGDCSHETKRRFLLGRKAITNLVQFSCSVVSNPLWPHGLHAACQASLSFPIFLSLFKLMSIESVTPSNYLILCCPLLQPSFFPEAASFPMSPLFASGGQSIGTSSSFLPMNIQGWFPLGLTGLNSLLSKGLSRVFSSTTVWKHQFFGAQPSLWSNSH